MIKIKISSFVGAGLAAGLLVGCGGGGGGSNLPTYALQPTLAGYVAGDGYEYLVTGSQTVTGGATTNFTNGSRTVSVLAATQNGASVLHIVSNTTAQSITGINNYLVVTQASAGSPVNATGYYSGENGDAEAALAAPISVLPGSWSTTAAESGTEPLTNGGTLSYSLSYVGQSTVATSFANFQCYEVHETTTYTNAASKTVTTDGDYWWAPEMGSYIKANETVTDTINGTTTTTQSILSSSTVTPH